MQKHIYLNTSQVRVTMVFWMMFPLFICIDKTDPEDSNKREHIWRHTLKKMAPQGLNVEDD